MQRPRPLHVLLATVLVLVTLAPSGAAARVQTTGAPSASGNSTEKVRPAPSAFAERAGSAVAWRTDLDAALAEAAALGRPVFWYVPKVHGSFVDREVELDRKFRAGPFSWPRLVDALNERFVPLRLDVDAALGERFGVRRETFFAPGFLVLEGGVEVARQDRITTHHPIWWWDALGLPETDDDARITRAAEPDAAESAFLRGVGAAREVRERHWKQLMLDHPRHPLAWKAAMELEGHGPLVRGQESYAPLPGRPAVGARLGTVAPEGWYAEDELWRRGRALLVALREEDGLLRDSIYDFGGTDSLPNVYAATSALASIALAASRPAGDAADDHLACFRAASRVALEPNEDLDERAWAQLYCVRACASAVGRREVDDWTCTPELLQQLVDALVADQLDGGAWRHEYPSAFVTADVLVALWEAKRVGAKIPDEEAVVGPAVDAILRCRSEDGGYSYYLTREGRAPRAAIQGAVGRGPKCELALHRWRPDACRGLERTIAASFEHEGPLLEVQKLDDHGPKFAYGGFFFWWDLHARTEAIAALPPGSARDAFAARQRTQVLSLPEVDGCFVDSHELGRGYGTAMALWCLAILDELEPGR